MRYDRPTHNQTDRMQSVQIHESLGIDLFVCIRQGRTGPYVVGTTHVSQPIVSILVPTRHYRMLAPNLGLRAHSRISHRLCNRPNRPIREMKQYGNMQNAKATPSAPWAASSRVLSVRDARIDTHVQPRRDTRSGCVGEVRSPTRQPKFLDDLVRCSGSTETGD